MLFLLCFLISLAAEVEADEPEVQTPTADQTARGNAESVRLSHDMKRLASRNAWSGVERIFQLILETGVTPSWDDYISAAHAARTTGDVTAVRERLLAANIIQESKEVHDWLWTIDNEYGQTQLAADKKYAKLDVAVMPFNPDQVAAIKYAQSSLEEEGIFEGFLPAGDYIFTGMSISVRPRVSSIRIDLRGSGKPKTRD